MATLSYCCLLHRPRSPPRSSGPGEGFPGAATSADAAGEVILGLCGRWGPGEAGTLWWVEKAAWRGWK